MRITLSKIYLLLFGIVSIVNIAKLFPFNMAEIGLSGTFTVLMSVIGIVGLVAVALSFLNKKFLTMCLYVVGASLFIAIAAGIAGLFYSSEIGAITTALIYIIVIHSLMFYGLYSEIVYLRRKHTIPPHAEILWFDGEKFS